VTRIVTTTYRYKRPPKKRKAVALEVPVIVATKRSRRSMERAAAEAVSRLPRHDNRAAQPTTPRDAERDYAVTAPPPANGDRKSAIVTTTTSRKRLKLLRADQRSAQRDDDPEAMARVRAFFARNVRPGGPLPPKPR